MPTAKVTMKEAQGLRCDERQKSQCRERADQWTQPCLTQTHHDGL